MVTNGNQGSYKIIKLKRNTELFNLFLAWLEKKLYLFNVLFSYIIRIHIP